MVTMNISLPDTMKTFIDRRIAEAGYNTASEYVHDLVRLDQERLDQKKLEAVLVERLEGDDWEEMSPNDWSSMREELQTRLSKKGQA